MAAFSLPVAAKEGWGEVARVRKEVAAGRVDRKERRDGCKDVGGALGGGGARDAVGLVTKRRTRRSRSRHYRRQRGEEVRHHASVDVGRRGDGGGGHHANEQVLSKRVQEKGQ